MRQDSTFIVKDAGSALGLSAGSIFLYTNSILTLIEYGTLGLTGGDIKMKDSAKIDMSQNAQLYITDTGSIEALDISIMELATRASATLNGTAIFKESTQIIMDTDSQFNIYGSLTLGDTAKVFLSNDARMDILQDGAIFGLVTLSDFTEFHNTGGELGVSGTLLLSNNSQIIGSNGKFFIQSEQIKCTSDSRINLSGLSEIEIDGDAK